MRYLSFLYHECLASFSSRLREHEQSWKCWKLLEQGVLSIGRHTYGLPRVHSYAGSERKVVVGAFCSISPDITIITGGIHPMHWISTYPFRIMWKMKRAYVDGMPTLRETC